MLSDSFVNASPLVSGHSAIGGLLTTHSQYCVLHSTWSLLVQKRRAAATQARANLGLAPFSHCFFVIKYLFKCLPDSPFFKSVILIPIWRPKDSIVYLLILFVAQSKQNNYYMVWVINGYFNKMLKKIEGPILPLYVILNVSSTNFSGFCFISFWLFFLLLAIPVHQKLLLFLWSRVQECPGQL